MARTATRMSTPTRTETARAPGPASAAPALDPHPAPERSAPTARIHAEHDGGRSLLTTLRSATPWAPRPLRSTTDGTARVALVQTAATLVSGDDARIAIVVGEGAALDVVETGATIAHHVRDGPPARLAVTIELGAGARLRWLGRPLVLAHGCAVARVTRVTLAAGARALLRETVVLGRSGERPGALRSDFRATHDGRPLLHERLDTADLVALRSPVVAGDASLLDSVLLLGARGADLPGASQLAGPGTVWRALHRRGADPDDAAADAISAWDERDVR